MIRSDRLMNAIPMCWAPDASATLLCVSLTLQVTDWTEFITFAEVFRVGDSARRTARQDREIRIQSLPHARGGEIPLHVALGWSLFMQFRIVVDEGEVLPLEAAYSCCCRIRRSGQPSFSPKSKSVGPVSTGCGFGGLGAGAGFSGFGAGGSGFGRLSGKQGINPCRTASS